MSDRSVAASNIRFFLSSVTIVMVVACGNRQASPADSTSSALGSHPDASLSTGREDSIARARQDSVNRAQPGYVVDSILPPAEALRRFMADVASPPTTFANGASSRDALVRTWVRALESNDSLALIRTAMNRPEFAFLVYRTSPNAAPPYNQPPALMWMQLSNASLKGFRRSLQRLGGKPLGFLNYRCAPKAVQEGENRLWTDCLVRRVRAPGDTVSERLFGAIIERRGHFKFYSLANDV